MTREEFRDYVDFLRSQDEISYDVYSELIDGIGTLEQEPKTGHWIVNEWGNIFCSECGCAALYDKIYPGESVFGKAIRVKSTFCPTCGAKMEVEQNG